MCSRCVPARCNTLDCSMDTNEVDVFVPALL